MCDRREHTVTNQSDSLCDESDCELTKKGGVWICCICDFGWQTDGPNRYRHCSAGGCIHETCEDCKTWNAENVALMKAAHEAEQENAEEEQHGEDSPEREEESTEEYPYEDEAEEYSYEGEAEEEVDYSAYKEEGGETLDDSLYEPSTEDDSE